MTEAARISDIATRLLDADTTPSPVERRALLDGAQQISAQICGSIQDAGPDAEELEVALNQLGDALLRSAQHPDVGVDNDELEEWGKVIDQLTAHLDRRDAESERRLLDSYGGKPRLVCEALRRWHDQRSHRLDDADDTSSPEPSFMPQAELVRDFERQNICDKTYLSKVLTRLDKAGLIMRVRDSDDARQVQIALTWYGERALGKRPRPTFNDPHLDSAFPQFRDRRPLDALALAS